MDIRISDLLEIIQEEVRLYRELIEHTQRKSNILVQGCVETILESNRVDEMYHAKIRALENKRLRLCQDLSRSLRIPPEEATLMKLTDYLEPSFALEVRTQATLLRDAVMQLKALNRRNRKLVERIGRYSQGLLSLFYNAMSSYRQTGQFEPTVFIRPTYSRSA
jgi:hypothetical protein